MTWPRCLMLYELFTIPQLGTMSTSTPTPIFGCASVGFNFITKESVEELLSTVKNNGIKRIDTAGRYPPTSPGASECLLGEAGATDLGFQIDTKVLVLATAAGSLSAENIAQSVQRSFDRLRIQQINTLYCHMPDPETPLLEQAKALNEQYEQGRFKQLGVSNFSVPMMKEFFDICTEHNFVKPSVYQGQYNLLRRGDEQELIPFLRANGCAYVAFSPLGGGFLTGRCTAGIIENTRFAGDNPMSRAVRAWYDKPQMHGTIKKLEELLTGSEISMPEAALRWLFHHSMLREPDSVLLGASKAQQIETNMRQIAKGPLPDAIVVGLGSLWADVEGCAP
ncbi:hypothetical protein BP5796_10275 [Coleophoma crateriformis]|uniref:NADP-dependent oxidoreductase domain-containing protein n=1 Tax=Coleophoma crateriformis TaxID=565419 RepID=A0A3D8QUQ1_9HELO|nr:hypothetical protein BP5796_10275 [Coleophoma crateriformis]